MPWRLQIYKITRKDKPIYLNWRYQYINAENEKQL